MPRCVVCHSASMSNIQLITPWTPGPWKINGWNLQITHEKKGNWSSKPPWLCSMLIFRGVQILFLDLGCFCSTHGFLSWGLSLRIPRSRISRSWKNTWKIVPGLGYVVHNHGDRKSPIPEPTWDPFQMAMNMAEINGSDPNIIPIWSLYRPEIPIQYYM